MTARSDGATSGGVPDAAFAAPGWVTARHDRWGASTHGASAVGIAVCMLSRRVAVATENGVVGVWSIRVARGGLTLTPTHEIEAGRRVLGVAWSPAGDGRLAVSGLGMVRIRDGEAPHTLWSVPECPKGRMGPHRPAWWGNRCLAVAQGGSVVMWYDAASGRELGPVRGHGRVVVCGDTAVNDAGAAFVVWALRGGTPRVRARLPHGGAVQRWDLAPRGSALWAVDYDGRMACWTLPNESPTWATRPDGRVVCVEPGEGPLRATTSVALPRPTSRADAPGMRVMCLWVRPDKDDDGGMVVHASAVRGHYSIRCSRDGDVRSRHFAPCRAGDWVVRDASGATVTSCGLLEGSLGRPRDPQCVPHDAVDAGEWGLALALRGGRGVQVWLPLPNES